MPRIDELIEDHEDSKGSVQSPNATAQLCIPFEGLAAVTCKAVPTVAVSEILALHAVISSSSNGTMMVPATFHTFRGRTRSAAHLAAAVATITSWPAAATGEVTRVSLIRLTHHDLRGC